MRALYAALLGLLTPLYLARLWWRGRREPLYRHAIAQRLGFTLAAQPPGAIWLHAVSLGETRAAAPLIAALRAALPGRPLLLTSTTATGWAAAEALLAPGDRHTWLPYDTPGAVRRFLRAQQPALGVLMETEVWPVLIHEAQRARVPLVLANARLSERSARKGQRYAALLRPAARALALTLAQTPADAQRLRAAGAAPVEVAGNLKFDVTPSAANLALGAQWRARLAGRTVVLAASTREAAGAATPGASSEEAELLAHWAAALRAQRSESSGAPTDAPSSAPASASSSAPPGAPPSGPPPLLVIVPRHPPRFDAVAEQVRAAGFTLARRSAFVADAPSDGALHADVWLGDSLGELAAWYALADVALLGGSFAPHGGQNLIEAAACGCPLVMGPSTFNFAQAADDAVAAGAARRAPGWGEAVAQALALASDAPRRAQASQQALAFAQAHQGAATRMAQRIAALLRESS